MVVDDFRFAKVSKIYCTSGSPCFRLRVRPLYSLRGPRLQHSERAAGYSDAKPISRIAGRLRSTKQ